MPHKFNAAWRHKFKKKRYRITNWSEYTESLRRHGDVTVWLSPEVEVAWRAERRKTRGGQPVYSNLAIMVCLTLGMVYNQPLHQTEGSGLTLPTGTCNQRGGPIEHITINFYTPMLRGNCTTNSL